MPAVRSSTSATTAPALWLLSSTTTAPHLENPWYYRSASLELLGSIFHPDTLRNALNNNKIHPVCLTSLFNCVLSLFLYNLVFAGAAEIDI